VVWRLDCVVGSLKDLIGLISTVLDSRASLHSLTEDFAVSSRNGRNMLHTLNALSDFQYSLIKHRTIQGLRQARAKGRVGGRPRKLGPAQIKKAEAMLDKARMTKTEVATHFGVCRQTLNQALAMSASRVS
jgi:DNA invertase Pin-like site-specific DNA recombinase